MIVRTDNVYAEGLGTVEVEGRYCEWCEQHHGMYCKEMAAFQRAVAAADVRLWGKPARLRGMTGPAAANYRDRGRQMAQKGSTR